MADAPETVTLLLRAWQSGDGEALGELTPLVYAELHRIAAARMRSERGGHTLSPTALVSEAFMRLVGAQAQWDDRVHFYAVAARTMRRVLVDHARAHAAAKRGGPQQLAVTFDEARIGEGRPEQLVALDDALTALAQRDERKVKIIEMIYFAGMTQQEVATALGVHVNTVARELRLGEAWIHRELTGAR